MGEIVGEAGAQSREHRARRDEGGPRPVAQQIAPDQLSRIIECGLPGGPAPRPRPPPGSFWRDAQRLQQGAGAVLFRIDLQRPAQLGLGFADAAQLYQGLAAALVGVGELGELERGVARQLLRLIPHAKAGQAFQALHIGPPPLLAAETAFRMHQGGAVKRHGLAETALAPGCEGLLVNLRSAWRAVVGHHSSPIGTRHLADAGEAGQSALTAGREPRAARPDR